jgi:hypothetical protein
MFFCFAWVGNFSQRARSSMRWFLSYHSPDQALAERLKAAIECKDSGSRVFFAPMHLRAGGSWSAQLAQEIAEADAFILLVGEAGVGNWQVPEYHDAHDRWVNARGRFLLIVVLLQGQSAPGLPFLRQLHWIVTSDPASAATVGRIFDAIAGDGGNPGELWRYTSPYRGLAAMEEKDSDYFFGRGRETVEVLRALEATPEKLPVLLGNSGVGKSSLAQAGVLAALVRQAWPETATAAGAWPQTFNQSRGWCVLTLKPGAEPVRALVEPFIRTWQFDATDPRRDTRLNEWIDALIEARGTLRGLLNATQERFQEQGRPQLPAFLLYIDQGEELYVRSEPRQRRRFSELLAEALADPRMRAMMSLRADFFGELLNDEPLQDVSRKIEVPPLREAQLREVVSKPAVLLGARFENEHLAFDIAERAAEESTRDAGALPLLSYLLDDMWKSKDPQWDGVLRLPAPAIELGRVLVDRANAFIATHPGSEDALRRIFTLKLATVREDGEPTRRRAFRAEFTDYEWRLVSELADHPYRLLITATADAVTTPVPTVIGSDMYGARGGVENYAQAAHEAIFRRWDKLKEWMAAEREFLTWRSGLEAARRDWQLAPDVSKNNALLMGFALERATNWIVKRAGDLSVSDRKFIAQSIEREKNAQSRSRRWALALASLGLSLGSYFLLLVSPEPSLPLILAGLLLPIMSLSIRVFGVQAVYSRLHRSFENEPDDRPSLVDHLRTSVQKGILGGYLGSQIPALYLAFAYYTNWAADFNRPPPEPVGQLALEVSISTALIACVLGFCCVFMSRLSAYASAPNSSRNALLIRGIIGSALGGTIAGGICAAILIWYFSTMSRPVLTPTLLLPSAMLGTFMITFSITNFDFEHLNARRFLAASAAAVAAAMGGAVAVAVFILLYLSGALSFVIEWILDHPSNAGVVLAGGAFYGIPVGLALGLTLGIASLLTERWTGNPTL